jgi:hypothetical protein
MEHGSWMSAHKLSHHSVQILIAAAATSLQSSQFCTTNNCLPSWVPSRMTKQRKCVRLFYFSVRKISDLDNARSAMSELMLIGSNNSNRFEQLERLEPKSQEAYSSAYTLSRVLLGT